MQKLTWDVVAVLLLTYGIPTADAIVRNWLRSEPVTDEQWVAVRETAIQSARAVMLKKLTEAGVDPESEQGKALLALTPL